MRCASCPGREGGVCGVLSEAALARVASCATTVRLPADTCLCDEDVGCKSFALVQSGLLRMQSYSLCGRRKITGLAGPGDSLGQAVQGPQTYSIETVAPVQLCRFDRTTFSQLIDEEPELRRALCKQAQTWVEKARRLSWILGALAPAARLRALFLLSRGFMPWPPLPEGGGILTMELPRQDIADLLATTQETVSRSLHQLQKDGLIEIMSAPRFRLIDIDGVSEGSEGSLKL